MKRGAENGGPLLSVIIVNWNGLRFLNKNLSSIFAQTFKGFEVVFVDNGSKDSSVEYVRRFYPDTVIIENGSNLGFAKANNIGIARSRGKYILTLNNDTELEKDFFERLVEAAEATGEKTGMWAPKILSIEKRSVIDSVGGLLIYPDGLAKGRGRLEEDSRRLDAKKDAFIPSACAGLYRKKMLDEVGGFDEDFFAYCEDTDLGLRARLYGWEAASVPGAVVYHHYSGTGGRYSALKAYLVERNRLWVAVKNLPLRFLVKGFFYTKWRYAVQVYGILSGKGAGARFSEDFSKLELLKVLVKAYIDAFKGMPKMLGKRAVIQRGRRASNSEIKSWFSLYGLKASEVVLAD